MNYRTLMEMSHSAGGSMSKKRAKQLIGPLNDALIAAHCTTHKRAAMFMAQTGEETLLWTAVHEFASGAEYNGRADLGNTHPGDGERFKGSGFIQLTGRDNFHRFGKWCHLQPKLRKYVRKGNYFLIHPNRVCWNRFVWQTVVFYWTVARPQMNYLADHSDIVGATRAVNGGTNGLERREQLWNLYKGMGDKILPATWTQRKGETFRHMFKKDRVITTEI